MSQFKKPSGGKRVENSFKTEEGWSTQGLGYLKKRESRERVYVVHPYERSNIVSGHVRSPEAEFDEACRLTEAISVDLVDGEIVPVRQVKPATYLGRGKLDEYRVMADALDIGLFIFDCALSPIQQRNLEKALDRKVIDRTALILEIFGDRASTKEGELQVELAHLIYQKSRLVRSWTHLERQRGSLGFIGGPGETQIEADRRQIDERITRIKKSLGTITRTRSLHRERRQKAPYPVVALVGYTNAGKSTLFNRLTNAEVLVEDMLFATLDPTLRSVNLPSGRKIILSDTVGFVSNLPTMLIAAFRATLEEVLEADIVVHVRDASHPDWDVQKQDVEDVLSELGFNSEESLKIVPIIEAFNKSDQLDREQLTVLNHIIERSSDQFLLSGLSGEGCDTLITALDEALGAYDRYEQVLLDFSEGAAMAWLRAHSEILSEKTIDEGVLFTVRIDPLHWDRFQNRIMHKRQK